MKNAKALFNYDSLAFFGRVNASISHELKNIMAIISETAGLLSDLSEMASDGNPVNPDLLKSSTDSIMEEIQRGFTTIRQMNRFSHSVDASFDSINLLELLDMMRHLSEYLPYVGKTRLLEWNGKPPVVQICPFALQAIVYEIFVQNFKYTGPNTTLDISVQSRSDSEWVVVFSGFSIGDFQVFPDDQIKKTAESIGVTIEWTKASYHLKLHVPSMLPSGVGDDGLAERMDNSDTPPIHLETR
jgi:signal transduction histidine kinase